MSQSEYAAIGHEENVSIGHERVSQDESSSIQHELQDARNQSKDDSEKPLPMLPVTTPSTTLYHSGSILLLLMLYISLAVFPWVVTCYLSIRPITAQNYGAWVWNHDYKNYGWSGDDHQRSLYDKNQGWYHTARVIQSIVGVLTIPLTSALCSSAAVIFMQRRQGGLSIRQVMTIADKSWTDIPTIIKTFPFFGTKGWKRYGSSFLLLAIFLNLLGSIIGPVQEIFLSTTTIKTPTWPSEILSLLDLPDQWEPLSLEPVDKDINLIVALTRSALASATNSQVQAQLWQTGNVSCALGEEPVWRISDERESCRHGGATFGNMSQLEHPFLAELTSGYHTGLIQQFLPRINSTARYESISADDFPKNCDQIDGAFYVKYMHIEQEYMASWGEYMDSWGLEACMPGNMTKTPWRPTRDRQDFSEELFLNVTLTGENLDIVMMDIDPALGNSDNMFYKITLNTTAGYFELPNYKNGGVAGPLLEKDPNGICGNSCETEGDLPDIYNHGKDPKSRRDGNIINNDDSSLPLEEVLNKGPLLTIAMALFGEGSFIQDRLAYPHAYASHNADPRHIGPCLSLAPMGFLLSDDNGLESDGNPICIRNTDGGVNSSRLDDEIVRWIQDFGYDEERLSNAFTAAAFLANQAWMENNIQPTEKTLIISFDMGYDTQILVLSRGGLILVSILLGLYILILFPLAVYAASVPRWTSTLDSFAMMRIGAAVADKVPLLVSRDTDKIDVLDDIPGYIGDQSEESCDIGKLGLGGTRPLGARQNKVFESY